MTTRNQCHECISPDNTWQLPSTQTGNQTSLGISITLEVMVF